MLYMTLCLKTTTCRSFERVWILFSLRTLHEAFRGLGISRFHCRKEAMGPKGSCFSEWSGSQCWGHLTSWRFSLLYVYICVLERISHHDCSLLSLQPQKAQTPPSLFRSKHRSRHLGGRRKLSFVFLAIHTFYNPSRGTFQSSHHNFESDV